MSQVPLTKPKVPASKRSPRGGDRRLRVLAVVAAIVGFPALLLSLRPAPQVIFETDEDGRQIITTRTEGPTVGMPAPDFTLETFDGRTVTSDDLQDRITIIYFYASWCPTCETELPQLAALSAVMSNYGQILGVAIRDEPGPAEALIDSTGARDLIPAGMDPGDRMSREFLVLGAPGTVVIGPNGVVDGDWRGPISMQFLFDFMRDTYPEVTAGASI
jgi:cytochrome c biogenesis protein CcmG, thiol:disulfide interchange protein DsbE